MAQTSNVHLRWNKHQATLVSVFDALFDSEKLTDCTVSAEGQHFRAHKIILSACSPYFEELFVENYEKHPIVILPDVKYHSVKALMDFMYRGEVSVPQEELSGVLKLSESLQIRGLSGNGYVNDVNMQKGGGRNAPPVSPEIMRSQPASVSCFTLCQKEPEEEVQSFSLNRRCNPTLSSEGVEHTGIDSIPKATQKYRSSNHPVSDQRTDQNLFEEVTSPDFDSMHHLPAHRQGLPTASNPAGGSVFNAVPRHSVRSESMRSSEEVVIAPTAGKEQFLMPEAVLSDKRSANLSVHQEKLSLEAKSEDLESHMEIVEDLTLDDDDDYCDDGNSVNNGKGRRVSQDLTYEDNIGTRGMNSLQSALDNDYLRNRILSTPTTLPMRFDCPTCGKSYLYRSGLLRHLKHECGKEPQFQCPRCNKRCARSDQLRSHMSSRRCRMQNSISYFEGNG